MGLPTKYTSPYPQPYFTYLPYSLMLLFPSPVTLNSLICYILFLLHLPSLILSRSSGYLSILRQGPALEGRNSPVFAKRFWKGNK